jgi:hypothetical protein
MAGRDTRAGLAELRHMSTLSHSREVLLWLGTQKRRSILTAKNHTDTRDEIVKLESSERLEHGHLYALGVE